MFRKEEPMVTKSAGDQESWKECAQAYFQHLHQAPRKQKDQRLATYEFLCAIDAVLRTLAGKGIRDFIHDSAVGSIPGRLPGTLGLTMDQCSTNWSANYYLLFKLHACCAVFPDPFHRMWNDTKAGLRRGKCWGTVLALLPALNLAYGPWSGCKWWSQMNDALIDWLAGFKADDPLWQWIFPRLCRDVGEGGEEHFEGKEEEMLQRLQLDEQFRVKGPRVTLCRWWNWFDAAGWLLERWHSRLLVLLYLGLQDGSMLKASSVDLLKSLTPRLTKEEHSQDSTNMKESKEAADRVRDKCKNTCHYAAIVMQSPKHIATTRLVMVTTAPYRKWHGQACHKLRSPSEALAFRINFAKGDEVFPMVHAVSQTIKDLGALSEMGFKVGSGVLFGKKALPPEHPEVMADDYMARRCFGLVLSLMAERMLGCLDLVYGYPALFALLLDPATCKGALATIKKDKAAYEALLQRTDRTSRRVAEKSMFGTRLTQEVLAALEHLQWTENLEDGVGAERELEKQNPKKKSSNLTIWRQLSRKRVLTEIHGFDEVDPSAVPMPSLKRARIPNALFRTTPKLNTVNVRSVVGKGAPDWPTRKPHDQFNAAAELLWVRHLWDIGDLGKLAGSWHTALLQVCSLVKPPKHSWMWVLSNMGGARSCGRRMRWPSGGSRCTTSAKHRATAW